MRNLLALCALVVLAVGGTGWYRGWYAVEPLPADLGKMAFRVEIDRVQIGKDAVDAVKALQRLTASAERKDEKKSPEAAEGGN